MQSFILQANAYGASRRPCFFYVDFELKTPHIFPLEDCKSQGIYFHFPQRNNQKIPVPFSTKPTISMANPTPFRVYQQGFQRVQQALRYGDSYLLNLTFPTEIALNGSLESLFYHTYAPFKLYVEDQFVCFSPEAFVETHHQQIFTYPMKGTYKTTWQNKAQAKASLLNSAKEQREHYCIVDLMRNDLAMVSENIHVKRFRFVEEIHTPKGLILQTSSEICGDLGENWQANLGDLLAKLLPAGSISGAPKEKTVQTIRQAERGKRGYYTGVFGYFDGEDLHSAVAIRFIEKQGEKYFFRSGGGITLHSQVEQEYDELLQKVVLPQSTLP